MASRQGQGARSRRPLLLMAGILVFLVSTPRPSHPQSTWLTTSTTNYGTATNWGPSGVPGAGQTAIFSDGTGNQPVVAGNFTIGTVNMTAGSLTINSGNTYTVQTAYNLTNASILGSGTLSLNAGSLLTAAGASADVIAATVAGAGAVTITGSNVTFTAANTYSGITTINAGG